MINPFTMFMEKDVESDLSPIFSMTRVVAFMFASVYCFALVRYAASKVDIGWPFCALGVVVVLAVPLQTLFKFLGKWFATSPGQKLIGVLLDKVGAKVESTVTSSVTSSSIPNA